MNRSESKYFNTAVRMDEALLTLLETKELQFITVKEICAQAQVNRSTFYLHYQNISDLLGETVEYSMRSLDKKYKSIDVIKEKDIATCHLEKLVLISPKYLVPYLEFVRENQKIFRLAVTRPDTIGAEKLFKQRYDAIFRPIMLRFGVEEGEMRYRMAFYLNGMFALVIEWIKNGCAEDPAAMAELMVKCIFPRNGPHA